MCDLDDVDPSNFLFVVIAQVEFMNELVHRRPTLTAEDIAWFELELYSLFPMDVKILGSPDTWTALKYILENIEPRDDQIAAAITMAIKYLEKI
jgi:hypothetical protein